MARKASRIHEEPEGTHEDCVASSPGSDSQLSPGQGYGCA